MKDFMEETFGKVGYILMFIVLFIVITGISCLGVYYTNFKDVPGDNNVNMVKEIASLSFVRQGVYVFKDNETKKEFLIFYCNDDIEVVVR